MKNLFCFISLLVISQSVSGMESYSSCFNIHRIYFLELKDFSEKFISAEGFFKNEEDAEWLYRDNDKIFSCRDNLGLYYNFRSESHDVPSMELNSVEYIMSSATTFMRNSHEYYKNMGWKRVLFNRDEMVNRYKDLHVNNGFLKISSAFDELDSKEGCLSKVKADKENIGASAEVD